MGLVGFGRIGRAMARRSAGFGMRLVVHDPYSQSSAHSVPRLEFATLDDVVAQADFLSLHCVLTPETCGILGAEQFRKMKPSALLINVSRGALVDESALVEALRRRHIAGAACDVFTTEPLSPDHPLFGFDNVLLTPHFAFYSREAHQRLEHECLQAVRDLLAGAPPKNVKNR
jgi:phosphoglycerate dehydrogenase-like enzyme